MLKDIIYIVFYPLSKPEAPQSICQGWRLKKKRSLISGSSDSALSLPFAEPDFGALDLSAEIESEKLYIKRHHFNCVLSTVKIWGDVIKL